MVDMKELLEAGVHFGHQTRRWDPKMRPYIFMERNGIHIIDLQKTIQMLERAYQAVREAAAAGEMVLFVGTKRQAKEAVREAARSCGMPYVTERWLGGTLTNFQTIRANVNRLQALEAMEEECNTKTITGYRAHLATFLEILGDVPIAAITRKRARESVKILKQLPPNRNKSKPYRDLSITAIIQLKPEKVMSVTTVRLYVERITALFDFAIKEQHTDYNPYSGLKPKRTTRPDQERKQFTSSDLAALFSPKHFQPEPGKPSRSWIPIIAVYTGMRLEEICQLRTQDIQHPNGIPCLDINDYGNKKLKNKTAVRTIPIHSNLIKLGFINFASKQQGRLFPELIKANGKRGHHFSKWFRRYREQCGVTEPGKTFHSFRHTVATALPKNLWVKSRSERLSPDQLPSPD